MISIHALREEGDSGVCKTTPAPNYFYPRPPRGGRRVSSAAPPPKVEISIHALREEGDLPRPALHVQTSFISIHALREEGDTNGSGSSAMFHIFLSTPSARRATSAAFFRGANLDYFYPRPPRGGRRVVLIGQFAGGVISIHALREEGDPWRLLWHNLSMTISIHALREEGDSISPCGMGRSRVFLSTPSARRATLVAMLAETHIGISIHALREEGDRPPPGALRRHR